MDCDKSPKQGDSRALGPGPGESVQPGQLERRGWARPKGRGALAQRHLLPRASVFPSVKREVGLDFLFTEQVIHLTCSLEMLLPELSLQFWETGHADQEEVVHVGGTS